MNSDSAVDEADISAQGGGEYLSRTGRELLVATRPFAEESCLRSWWNVASTFLALLTALTIASVIQWWPLRTLASVIGGLLFVRAFILFHDFMHGALLRESRLGQALFYLYGFVALTPPENWRRSHNFHHANVGKPIKPTNGEFTLLTSDVGAFPLMTTEMWKRTTTWQRLRYRVTRHPLTILCAYATVFLGTLCVAPAVQNPWKNWQCLVAIVVHGSAIAALWLLGGFSAPLFGFMLPIAIASAMGAYLFFAQHNFPGMRILPADQWSHYRGALESSSYMKLGTIMRWFTGNIGYHHVHHLNALIPFYRLPEAMAAIPELQQPVQTSLHPRDMLACFRLNLWDSKQNRLVGYREVASG